MTQPQLTHGLRLALDQLEEMVASFDSPHPLPQWRQHLIWQDIDRELRQAGYVEGLVWPLLDVYHQEREAARSKTHDIHPSPGAVLAGGPPSRETNP